MDHATQVGVTPSVDQTNRSKRKHYSYEIAQPVAESVSREGRLVEKPARQIRYVNGEITEYANISRGAKFDIKVDAWAWPHLPP